MAIVFSDIVLKKLLIICLKGVFQRKVWLSIDINSLDPNKFNSSLIIDLNIIGLISLGLIRFSKIRLRRLSLLLVLWDQRNNVVSRNYSCFLLSTML